MLTTRARIALGLLAVAGAWGLPQPGPAAEPESTWGGNPLVSFEARYRWLLEELRLAEQVFSPVSDEELREAWLGALFGRKAWEEVPAPLPEASRLWLQELLDAEQPRPFDGQASGQLEGPWGTLKTQSQVEAAPPDAGVRGAERWQTEESLQVPVAGPLYVFGQFRGGYNTWTAQEASLTGRTGVGCKLRPVRGGEVVLSGASVKSYAEDPLRPERLPREKSQMVVELQANYLLFGPLKVEYQGAATPALDPLEHNRLDQDVRLAIPLGNGGHFRVGAKHSWEAQPTTRPWTDGMQLYLGVGLKR